MNKISKEQAIRAEDFLKRLCKNDNANAYDVFISEEEAIFICEMLEKRGLINIIKTINDPLYLVTKTSKTCKFTEQGRL